MHDGTQNALNSKAAYHTRYAKKMLLSRKVMSNFSNDCLSKLLSNEVRLLDLSFPNREETCVCKEVQFITNDLILITGKQSGLICIVYSNLIH